VARLASYQPALLHALALSGKAFTDGSPSTLVLRIGPWFTLDPSDRLSR